MCLVNHRRKQIECLNQSLAQNHKWQNPSFGRQRGWSQAQGRRRTFCFLIQQLINPALPIHFIILPELGQRVQKRMGCAQSPQAVTEDSACNNLLTEDLRIPDVKNYQESFIVKTSEGPMTSLDRLKSVAPASTPALLRYS